MTRTPQEWMRQAIEMAIQNVRFRHGGPFAALVVKDGEIVGTGVNSVTTTNDPTAHAEMVAIRAACRNLSSFQLAGCDLYSSCEPCPMCLGAIYWARPGCFYFACNREDAGMSGFDDALIYNELLVSPEERTIPGHSVLREEGLAAFTEWNGTVSKLTY